MKLDFQLLKPVSDFLQKPVKIPKKDFLPKQKKKIKRKVALIKLKLKTFFGC